MISFQARPSSYRSGSEQTKERGIFPVLRSDINVYMGGSEEEEKPDVSFLGLHHRVRDTCVTSCTCTASA